MKNGSRSVHAKTARRLFSIGAVVWLSVVLGTAGYTAVQIRNGGVGETSLTSRVEKLEKDIRSARSVASPERDFSWMGDVGGAPVDLPSSPKASADIKGKAPAPLFLSRTFMETSIRTRGAEGNARIVQGMPRVDLIGIAGSGSGSLVMNLRLNGNPTLWKWTKGRDGWKCPDVPDAFGVKDMVFRDGKYAFSIFLRSDPSVEQAYVIDPAESIRTALSGYGKAAGEANAVPVPGGADRLEQPVLELQRKGGADTDLQSGKPANSSVGGEGL